jgi:hypothetical protein
MRTLTTIIAGAALVSALAAMPALAGNTFPQGKLLGKFNFIGHPKNVNVLKSDTSNGRAIMIPLKNATGANAIVCEADETILTDDTAPNFTTVEPAGAKVSFVPGDSFAILDRDATDANGALIQVPTQTGDGEQVLAVSIWLRILGKPNTCLDIDAYAYDADNQGGSLWFWAGSVDLNRKTGKATAIRVNELFDVNFCQVDPVLNVCVDGTTQELSVFNDVFEGYAWYLLNNGARNVEARLYPLNAVAR